MRDVRLNFSKRGRLRFISHLDLSRAMLRSLRRTDIPVWYTEGFNPHPYATFALPLPLGAESENDVMDIRVVGDIKNMAVMEKLNAVLPEGLEITDCYNPVQPVRAITKAEYLFFFAGHTDPAAVQALLDKGELFCEKTGKSHGKRVVKTVNLLEGVSEYRFKEQTGAPLLRIDLPAGSEKNVNPILLAETMRRQTGIETTLVRRVALLTETGSFK